MNSWVLGPGTALQADAGRMDGGEGSVRACSCDGDGCRRGSLVVRRRVRERVIVYSSLLPLAHIMQ